MKKIFSILALLAITATGQAQDSIHVAPAPTNWPTFEGTPDGWDVQVANFLALPQYAFAQDPNYYLSEYAADYSIFKTPLFALLGSRPTSQQLYEWALPSLKEKWAKMSNYERAAVFLAIRHAQQYMATFSEEAEDRYWHLMKNRQYVPKNDATNNSQSWSIYGESVFTRKRPTDFYDSEMNEPYPFAFPYRRVETFIYRRVKDGTPLGNLQYLADRMLQDFKLPQNGSFATKYPDGQLKEKGAFKDGLPHGEWQAYFGHVNDSGRYEMGVKEGSWASKNDRFGSEYVDRTTYRQGSIFYTIHVRDYNGKPAWMREVDRDKRLQVYERYYDGPTERIEQQMAFTWVPIVDEEEMDEIMRKFLTTLYVEAEEGEMEIDMVTNLEGGKVYIFELGCTVNLSLSLRNRRGEEVATGLQKLRFDVQETGEYRLLVSNADGNKLKCPLHQYFIDKE